MEQELTAVELRVTGETRPISKAVGGLPQRVPFGFHGNWVSDTSVEPPT